MKTPQCVVHMEDAGFFALINIRNGQQHDAS